MELYKDSTPKSAENFRALCTGERVTKSGTQLHYKNTKFHRIIPKFMAKEVISMLKKIIVMEYPSLVNCLKMKTLLGNTWGWASYQWQTLAQTLMGHNFSCVWWPLHGWTTSMLCLGKCMKDIMC